VVRVRIKPYANAPWRLPEDAGCHPAAGGWGAGGRNDARSHRFSSLQWSPDDEVLGVAFIKVLPGCIKLAIGRRADGGLVATVDFAPSSSRWAGQRDGE
jgi:hypothetical protein